MVDRTALEMRHTRKGIVGSNPTLSAIQSNELLSRQRRVLNCPVNWAFSARFGELTTAVRRAYSRAFGRDKGPSSPEAFWQVPFPVAFPAVT